MPPQSFGACHLPHHRPSDGAAVFKGVAAAAARLGQTSMASGDMAAVKAHLRRHYAQFGETVPDALREEGMSEPGVEIRMGGLHFRVEQREGSFTPIIRGYPIVFDSVSEDLGGFREVIRPQAMNRTLEEGIDLRLLVDHDTAKVLGRLTVGTLRVKKDATGLAIENDPPNTSFARDLVELIRRGDVSGGSFAFRTLEDKWNNPTEPGGTPLREILDMRVRECSIVTFPAYPATDVTVAKRALVEYQRRLAKPTVRQLQEQLEARRSRWGA